MRLEKEVMRPSLPLIKRRPLSPRHHQLRRLKTKSLGERKHPSEGKRRRLIRKAIPNRPFSKMAPAAGGLETEGMADFYSQCYSLFNL